MWGWQKPRSELPGSRLLTNGIPKLLDPFRFWSLLVFCSSPRGPWKNMVHHSVLPERPCVSLIWRDLGPKCCLSSSDCLSAHLLQLHCPEIFFFLLVSYSLLSPPSCPWFYQLRMCLCVVYNRFLNECLLDSWCCWHFGADWWEERRKNWIQDSKKWNHLIFQPLWLTRWFICL